MARYILLSVLLLPIVEIAIFIKVGQAIGLFPTLGLVIGAALLGGLVLKAQGMAVLTQLRSNMQSGQMPGRTIADAMMLGLAAVLLVLPGFFTDLLAILLLLPPVRSWIYKALASRVNVVATRSYGTGQGPRINRSGVVDLGDDEFRPKP